MPTYLFENTKTGEQIEMFIGISERDKLLKENPHLKQLVNGFPGTVDPTRIGRVKPDNGFKDVLKEINKHHRGSTLNDW